MKSPEQPSSENGGRAVSHGTAYLIAEGTMWLATGNALRDEREPAAAVLDRLEEKVPARGRYAWLDAPRAELGDRSAFELIDQDDFGPIVELLDALPERSPADGSPHGDGR